MQNKLTDILSTLLAVSIVVHIALYFNYKEDIVRLRHDYVRESSDAYHQGLRQGIPKYVNMPSNILSVNPGDSIIAIKIEDTLYFEIRNGLKSQDDRSFTIIR